jgi:hypothetical protein
MSLGQYTKHHLTYDSEQLTVDNPGNVISTRLCWGKGSGEFKPRASHTAVTAEV